MKIKLFLFLLFISARLCFAQLDEQWSFRDSIPGARLETIRKIITDASGNSYITGSEESTKSMFVKKIDSSGVLKWTKYYADSAGLWTWYAPRPGAIFFSKNGHIKIVGTSYNKNHIFLHDYDTSGNLMYNQILTDSATYHSPSLSFAVMDSSDNIYIAISNSVILTAGNSANVLYLLKYTSGGVLFPSYLGYPNQSGSNDYIESMAIDSKRNVSLLTNTTNNAFVNRFDSSGVLLFHIQSPIVGFSEGFVQNDESGHTYYCDYGYSGVAGSVYKIDSLSNILWFYSVPSFFYYDIAPDGLGNIYLCGKQAGYLIVQKLNASGLLLWTYQFAVSNHTTEIGTRIKIAKDGSLYIQGLKELANTTNRYEGCIVIHLDSSGAYISSSIHKELNSSTTFSFDFDFDDSNNLYINGQGNHGSFFSYPFIYKLCNNYCNGNITGKRFTDANSNCLYDSSEIVLPAQVLLLKPNNIYATTNTAGYYHFKTDSGAFVIKPIFPQYWATTCNKDSAIVNIDSSNPGDTIDFGSLGSGFVNINDLHLSYSMSNIVRPGFTQNSAITYYNLGTTVINNVLLQLNIDAAVFNFISAMPAPDSISGSSYFWKIGSLGLYASGVIHLKTKTPSTVPLLTHFTNSACISPYLTDTTRYNNCDTIRGEVRGSCDPNQKTVSTTQYNYQNPLTPTQNELAYHIDFQNTGNDTAFTISVIDTIDANLDIASLRFGASSHPYTWEVYGPGIIKFMFNNVLLPDSNVDEVNSHGFVKYYIRPNAGLDASTSISNTANIFFDYNANVRTNTVYYPPVLTHANTIKGTLLTELNLFPNPADKTLHISCSKIIRSAKIVDISGKLILIESLDSQLSINIAGLSSGIYFVDFFSDEEVFHAKFVKE